MARAILGQSYCNPAVVAQVVRDNHRVFWASLETKEPNQPVRNSTFFLQAVFCLFFFFAATEGCLPAWERAFKTNDKEILSWIRMLHREALVAHAGISSSNPNNALADLLVSAFPRTLR